MFFAENQPVISSVRAFRGVTSRAQGLNIVEAMAPALVNWDDMIPVRMAEPAFPFAFYAGPKKITQFFPFLLRVIPLPLRFG